MKLQTVHTALQKAKDVQIPDAFFKRMKTGIEKVDIMFGEGILPGSTLTLAGVAGGGKTTLLLQICELLADRYDVAYLSGEERIEMIAMSCRRLKTDNVAIAAECRLTEILEIIETQDLVVIDSFPSIRYNLPDEEDLSVPKQREKALNVIIQAAQKFECAVIFILHSTKMGDYKGGTELQHATDVNIKIDKDKDAPDIRLVNVFKNRVGATDIHGFNFGAVGYDFESEVDMEAAAADASESKSGGRKPSRNAMDSAAIMEMKDPPQINIKRVCDELEVDAARASWLLMQLVNAGKLEKFGRGASASWKRMVEE